MASGGQAALSRHIFPFGLEKGERELLASLFAAYPDFYDVALALIERYSCALASLELVDAAFQANGWKWPNHG